MRLDNDIPYKVYKRFNVDPIEERLSELSDEIWNIDTGRQADGAGPHRFTTSLILSYCRGEPELDRIKSEELNADKKVFNADTLTYENFINDVKKIEKRFIDEKINGLTNSIVEELEQKFEGIAGNVIYAKLPAGKHIIKHKDPGYYLSVVHRLHIPIKTNDKVIFSINNSVVNMHKGFVYEINNLGWHGVKNDGTEDRIHLIIDIIPKNKLI